MVSTIISLKEPFSVPSNHAKDLANECNLRVIVELTLASLADTKPKPKHRWARRSCKCHVPRSYRIAGQTSQSKWGWQRANSSTSQAKWSLQQTPLSRSILDPHGNYRPGIKLLALARFRAKQCSESSDTYQLFLPNWKSGNPDGRWTQQAWQTS